MSAAHGPMTDCEAVNDDLIPWRLGMLDAAEAVAVEAHLRGCPTCSERARGLEADLEALGQAAPDRTPPAGTWERIAGRLAAARDAVGASYRGPWPRVFPESKLQELLHRARLVPAEATPLRGVRAKVLERNADRWIVLLDVAPGGRLPAHPHSAEERLAVLAGSLTFDGEPMEAGEATIHAAGSMHGACETAGGCVVLLDGPVDDWR